MIKSKLRPSTFTACFLGVKRAFVLLIQVSFLLIVLECNAQQVTFSRTYDYGYAEAANAVITTQDGGYLLAGRQGIAPFNSKGLLVKTDYLGN